MSGTQLVVFPFLLLMLPIAVVLAWWLKRRYAAAIVRLQKESCFPETLQEDSTTKPASTPSLAHEKLPQLRLRIQPAHEVPYRSDGVDGTAAPRRLRRRELAVQFSSGLLYWCALLLLLVGVFAGPTSALPALMLTGPSLLPFLLLPAGVAWVLQAGVHRTLMNIAVAMVLVSGLGLLLYPRLARCCFSAYSNRPSAQRSSRTVSLLTGDLLPQFG